MPVILYQSTDASAPVLTGQLGSLVALLDAVLVNGYGAKAGAGWTKEFSATNKAVYRNSPTSGTGFYCDINDAGPGAGAAKESRMRGYEVMTAIATGSNPFPSVAQMANGLFIRKSISADATARPWYIIADSTCFYLFIDTGDYTAPAYALAVMFGDFFSYKTADAYRCAIVGRTSENTGATNYEHLGDIQDGTSNPLAATITGHYAARSHTGIGGAVLFAAHTSALSGYMGSLPGTAGSLKSLTSYPNAPDGALLLAPMYIGHDNTLRGYHKGLWCPLHNQPLGHADTFSGAGAMAGKTFLAMNIKTASNSATNGQLMIETSNTWG